MGLDQKWPFSVCSLKFILSLAMAWGLSMFKTIDTGVQGNTALGFMSQTVTQNREIQLFPLSAGEWLIQVPKTTEPFCCNGGNPGGRDTMLPHKRPTMDTLAMDSIQMMLDQTQ